MEINSSDRNMRPSSENSPAQASGSQGAVKKVTNNPSLLPPDLGPVADDVALSDDVTPWTEQDHGKMSEYMFMPLSHESVSYYEKKIHDITSALRHCEDQLDVTQEEKQKIESDFNALLYENNDLRSKYTGACSSYTYISEELNRFKQQAADLGDAAASLQREKESLAYEMGRELGRRESRDLSLTMASGMNRVEPDPTMLEEIKKVEAGLKKESWDCLKEISNAPELSTSVLRFVLRTASGAV
ncbi:hypothetical protein Tco_0892017 [Tanacetum coccineum]|uniref:Uncharacterized protein n=1 Tax=Tanacetum coccineum TaxID=301880 RepID=A0ABQ5C4N5_9ASTR